MVKKKKEYSSFIEDGRKYMQCKYCYDYAVVDNNAVAITCSRCVSIKTIQLMPLEEFYPSHYKKKSGRPPGWHWMNEFVDKKGNVFHKGKEQPELKGTLSPTKVKFIKRKEKLTADEKLQRDLNKWKKRKQSRKKKK